ncbi:hypothetical protein KA107_03280 [Candidatus Pacearchaeota archaeon]|nr:hypothetical protein [Candidatus Pacearchaeota archaeon]
MKFKKTSLALGSLLLGFLASSCNTTQVPKNYHETERQAKVVLAGKVEYNTGPLISHGFLSCSGIVFDYGNEAIMAHVLKDGSWKFNTYTGLGDNEAVQTIVDLSKEKGLDYRKARVVIDAGAKSSLEIILKDLKALGLKPALVKKGRLDDYDSRNSLDSTSIYYAPATDSLYERLSEDGDFINFNLEEGY